MANWSDLFLPSEQVLFSSPIHSRTRHGFFRAKRRVLVLTDLPRLVCVKEYLDRSTGPPNPTSRGISVKSELVFSLSALTAPRSVILHKITERSREVVDDEAEEEEAGGSTRSGTPATPPSPSPLKIKSRRKSSLSGTGHVEKAPNTGVVLSVEAKGDKNFVIQTSSKTYNYIADDVGTAARWVKEIGEARMAGQTQADGMHHEAVER